jgi:hypothetical protein
MCTKLALEETSHSERCAEYEYGYENGYDRLAQSKDWICSADFYRGTATSNPHNQDLFWANSRASLRANSRASLQVSLSLEHLA